MKSTKVRTIKTLGFTIGLLILISLSILSMPSNSTQNKIKNETISTLEAHDPIVLIGNDALADFCTIGNGTEANPYIIQNYEIDAGGSGSAIQLRNTDAYVLIRNCKVSGTGHWMGDAGISLRNCKNVQILGCTATNNTWMGIFIESSNNIDFSSNVIYSNNDYGVYIRNSNNILFSGENQVFSNGCGIELWSSSNIWMAGTQVYKNGIGVMLQYSNNNILHLNNISLNIGYNIWLYKSNNNSIIKNTVLGSYIGIELRDSTNNTLLENTVMSHTLFGIEIFSYSNNNTISGNIVENNLYGIYLTYYAFYNQLFENNVSHNHLGIDVLYWCNYNVIQSNIVTENTGHGIWLQFESNYNHIYENYITDNYKTGIWLINVSDNIIYHNNIIDNGYPGSDSNPTANYWHHPALLEGNYWSDYPGVDDGSGTGKHSIAGDGIGDTNIPWPSTDYDYYPFISETGWKPTICEAIENLKQMIEDSPDNAWKKPAENLKIAMIEKIGEAIELCQNGEYEECYDKILHDIKPKLTGLKMDEEGTIFGNGEFKNPWVLDHDLQLKFEAAINPILYALKNQ